MSNKNKHHKAVDSETELDIQNDSEDITEKEIISEEPKVPVSNKPVNIELLDSGLYKAEFIKRVGKTNVGTIVTKKGSIIKILLSKNIVKLI